MIRFDETVAGKKFFQGDLPAAVRAIQESNELQKARNENDARIATALEAIAEQLKAKNENDATLVASLDAMTKMLEYTRASIESLDERIRWTR